MPESHATSKRFEFIRRAEERFRHFLTPLLRGYIRRFPLTAGKPVIWTRVVAPYFAWRSYEFVAKTAFGKLMAGDTIEMLQQYVYFFGVWEPDLTRWIGRRLST